MEVVDREPKRKKAKSNNFFYGQIPIELLKDKKVKDEAKVQYIIYHSYSKEKDLKTNKCQCFASQSRIAKDFNLSISKIRRNQNKLEKAGWVHVRRRGGVSTNIVTLRYKPKKRDEKD